MSIGEEFPTLPGDLISAKKEMKAWENDDVRGDSGNGISIGEHALVTQVWFVDTQLRIRVVQNGQFRLYSCKARVFLRNWEIIGKAQS